MASGSPRAPNIVNVIDFGALDDGCLYLCHGGARGRGPGQRLDRARTGIPWRIAITRRALLGPASRPRPRCRAPRHQTRQHLPREPGRRDASSRSSTSGSRSSSSKRHRRPAGDARGHHGRDADVSVAGTGDRAARSRRRATSTRRASCSTRCSSGARRSSLKTRWRPHVARRRISLPAFAEVAPGIDVPDGSNRSCDAGSPRSWCSA